MFELVSPYEPAGDQPQAIAKLNDGILAGAKHQVLLGVTGSGKTFTIANVIKNFDRPTLVISHNKTLAAQLYAEFKSFFPNNAVEYLSATSIITSLRHTFRERTPSSRRIPASMMRSSGCGCRQ